MVPLGLRIRKTPTSIYGDDFVNNWNRTLTDCSNQLMQQIIKEESTVLNNLRTEIKQVQNEITTYAHLDAFSDMDKQIKTNIDKLEKQIMETKQTKLTQDQ